MTREEHILVHGMEECAEVQQRISKALRFGMEQIQRANWDKPEQNPLQLTNRARIMAELNDLYGVLHMLGMWQPDMKAMLEKQAKVERYLLFAKEQGTLT